jgi:hypothetical protein
MPDERLLPIMAYADEQQLDEHGNQQLLVHGRAHYQQLSEYLKHGSSPSKLSPMSGSCMQIGFPAGQKRPPNILELRE